MKPKARSKPLGRFSVLSIETRLTVLFALSTSVLLALTALWHYRSLEGSLAARDQAAITGKINVLRLLLRAEKDQSDLLVSEVEHEAAEEQPERYFLRVLESGGDLTIETTGMGRLAPIAAFPAPEAQAQRVVVQDGAREHVFLLRAAHASGARSSEQDYVLQVAFEITAHEELLISYRQRMLLSLALGIALAVAFGVLVARVAIRPLRVIARTLRRITVNRLNERLSPERWPRELRDLAGSCDEMLDRLQDSFGRLSQFSADLAHELRTPIGNLRGETEVALSRARSPGEYQQVLASNLEEYERLSRMIEGLLFLARAENPQTVLARVMIDASREMEAVRDFFDALAAERQVKVVREGGAQVFGDAMLVRRALSNLLSNALYHTPAGGSVVFTATPLSGGGAAIVVRDSGAGIAEEHLPRIFDRFYRADRSRRNSADGSGLGLAIVRSIMQLHGGEASIVSAPGKGTAVTLRFPPAAKTDERVE